LQEIKEAESKFPEKIKLKYKSKNSDNYQPICNHKNISWNNSFELFKEKPEEEPYCLDCGEDEDNKFTQTFQK